MDSREEGHPRGGARWLSGIAVVFGAIAPQGALAVGDGYIADIYYETGGHICKDGIVATGTRLTQFTAEQLDALIDETCGPGGNYPTYYDGASFMAPDPACWQIEDPNFQPDGIYPLWTREGDQPSEWYTWALCYHRVEGWWAVSAHTSWFTEVNIRAGDLFEVAKNTGEPECGVAEGNPINLGIGNKYLREKDVEGLGRLDFSRYYNSEAQVTGAALGARWRHSYARSVEAGAAPGTVVVRRPDGKAITFVQSSGQWTSDADVVETLEETVDGAGVRTGWRFHLADSSVESFDAGGRLDRIDFLDGRSVTLTYDPEGRLAAVVGDFGRALGFTPDAQGRIGSVTDPAGATYGYDYDAAGNLARVTYPDETPADPTDNPYREYLYEDPAFPHALTGIVDEAGNRLATYAYDARGRAVLSTHAGDAGRVDIAYDQPDGTVAVDNPKGRVRGYTLEVRHGVVKPAGIARQ